MKKYSSHVLGGIVKIFENKFLNVAFVENSFVFLSLQKGTNDETIKLSNLWEFPNNLENGH
jgi:hypothetical protein